MLQGETPGARAESGARDLVRYHELLEPLMDAMCVIDLTEVRYVYANAAMGRLLGSTAPNAGLDRDRIWTPDSYEFLQRVTPARLAAFLAGEQHHYVDELAMKRFDGTEVWTEARSYMLRDPQNGHFMVCATFKPVLKADRLGDLDGQQRLLDEIQELASVGIWTIDAFSRHGRWSEEIGKIHEVVQVDKGQQLLEQFDAPSLELLEKSEKHALATGEPYSLELPITTKAGNQKWLRISGRPVFEHGVAVRIRGVTQDITSRKEAELRLERERARLQSLLDHLPDIVAFKDLEGRVLACNSRVEQVFGVGRGELIGRTIDHYASKDVVETFGTRDEQVRKAHATIRGEDWITFADGHRELCESVTGPVRDLKGEVIGTLRIARDVTAKRAAEEQLRASQKMEAIGRLAGGVAHDFNNLLSVIASYTHLASDGLSPGHPVQEDLGEIRSAAKRAEALTRQLLAFSRRQLLQYTPLLLDEVVDTIGNMLRRLIGEDIELVFDRSPNLSTTKADRGQIEQVVMNLVVNARDAMPGGGRITVATRNTFLGPAEASRFDLPAGAYVELTVQDNGTGIEPEAMSRVFEPFFTTKGVGKGTGLGLSMVYGIVRQTGGGVDVDSTPGVGTIFHIFLPRFEGAGEVAPASKRPPPTRGSETILIVEDEAGLRAVAKRVLSRAGYKVFVAADADEAVSIARTEGKAIDLLFTDVVMPGVNGGELVERLTAFCPGMKVIFTSGYTDEKLAQSGVGAHCFLAKPYEPSQVTDTIRRVLDGPRV